MTELDDDQQSAMRFLEGIPKPGILSWFMTEEQEKQFIDGLKSDPESALGVMELAISIVLAHFGVSLTKTLVHRALTKSRRLSEFVRLRDEQPTKATPELLSRYLNK